MLTIGEIVAAHGTKGHVRVALYTDFPERFQELDEATIAFPDGRRTIMAVREAKSHPSKPLLILLLGSTRYRDEAVKLVGGMIEIDDNQAVRLPEGVYFEHDILGLAVVTDTGRFLGNISDIIRTGANDVYVVGDHLIPAIRDVVQDIDLEAGRVTIHPIPGLLEEDE